MLQAILIVLAGAAGIGFSARHLRRNWVEMASKKGSVKTSDLIFNYGMSFLWFGYLAAFFIGLIVNNLIIK